MVSQAIENAAIAPSVTENKIKYASRREKRKKRNKAEAMTEPIVNEFADVDLEEGIPLTIVTEEERQALAQLHTGRVTKVTLLPRSSVIEKPHKRREPSSSQEIKATVVYPRKYDKEGRYLEAAAILETVNPLESEHTSFYDHVLSEIGFETMRYVTQGMRAYLLPLQHRPLLSMETCFRSMVIQMMAHTHGDLSQGPVDLALHLLTACLDQRTGHIHAADPDQQRIRQELAAHQTTHCIQSSVTGLLCDLHRQCIRVHGAVCPPALENMDMCEFILADPTVHSEAWVYRMQTALQVLREPFSDILIREMGDAPSDIRAIWNKEALQLILHASLFGAMIMDRFPYWLVLLTIQIQSMIDRMVSFKEKSTKALSYECIQYIETGVVQVRLSIQRALRNKKRDEAWRMKLADTLIEDMASLSAKLFGMRRLNDALETEVLASKSELRDYVARTISFYLSKYIWVFEE